METEQLEQLLDVANRVGGAAWAAAVRGVQIEAAIDLVLGVVLLAAATWAVRRYAPGLLDRHRDDPYSGADMGLMFGGAAVAVVTVIGLLSLRFALVALAAPEWAALRALTGLAR